MTQSLWPVRHISVSIARSPSDVYAFARKPENLPRWASGLAGSVMQNEGVWIAESPMGRVTVRFAEENRWGVLDHDVTLPSGVTVHNPLRVLPNGGGSEIVFSLFRRPGMSEAEVEADASTVAHDLQTLAALLEG